MKGRIIALWLVATVFAISACDRESENTVTAEPIPYDILTTSVHLEVDDPHTQVFRSWEQWSAFWAEHPECDNGCVFSPPYVDFDSSLVAGIFWGEEPNIYPQIESRIESVLRGGETTVIRLREDQSHMVMPAYWHAYLFITFDRAEGPVNFTGVVPQ
ncbi:MAG: hypothetical protein IPG71_01235 [bacterium]|nr:hypothetical protein [bacterium]